jgi:hypothetical protein
VEPGEGG